MGQASSMGEGVAGSALPESMWAPGAEAAWRAQAPSGSAHLSIAVISLHGWNVWDSEAPEKSVAMSLQGVTRRCRQ
jgi:hypothetical protein